MSHPIAQPMTRGLLAAMLFAAIVPAVALRAEGQVIVLKAARVHIGDGKVVENGVVIVRNGRIEAVGAGLPVPDGAEVIELAEGAITPGLIDANASVEPADLIAPNRYGSGGSANPLCRFIGQGHAHDHADGGPHIDCCGSTCPRSEQHVTGEKCPQCGFPDAAPFQAGNRGALALAGNRAGGEAGPFASGVRVWRPDSEQSSEVIPHTRIIDAVRLDSPDFNRLAQGGVTTVFVAPDRAAVIGARGAIVRTAGDRSHRVLRETDAVTAAMGDDPQSLGNSNDLPFRENVTLYNRRPNTRMGVTWVFRKAFYDSKRLAEGIPYGGADTAPAAALKCLTQILAGEIPLRISARSQTDILAAVRLALEFNLPFTLQDGTESYKCIEELRALKTPVIYGPILDRPGGVWWVAREREGARLFTLRRLLDAGIQTALSAQDLREEDGLARQAMYAIRYGLTREEALTAVTATPAQILGIDAQTGTVAAGKSADLILWNGEPFDAASEPQIVMIGGELVRDQRSAK